MTGAIPLLPQYAVTTCTGQVYIQLLWLNTAYKHSKGNDACHSRVAVPDMRKGIPTRFRTVSQRLHGKLWPQTVFRSNCHSQHYYQPRHTRTMHDDQLLRHPIAVSDTMLCHDTQHTPYINNRPCQARYRGRRYRNSNFAYSSLRVHFITETLSFCTEHESPWTLCCTPKQHIPAGHGKTNRNTTIKFDFALQSARARRARNRSLSLFLFLSLSPCATIEAEESFARYAEQRRIMCCCSSSDPSYQQESSALPPAHSALSAAAQRSSYILQLLKVETADILGEGGGELTGLIQ